MKILHYGLSNNLGGIETYLFNLVNNIDKEKYVNDFLIIGYEKPCYFEELKKIGCQFHFITSRRQNPIKGVNEIKKILKNNNYDILHCHCNTLSYIAPILAAKKIDIKLIVHSRNGGAKVKFHSSILNFINRFRIPYHKCNLLAVSAEAGEWMFKNRPFYVINNGVDVDRYKFDILSRIKIRRDLNLENRKVLILAGALRPQKNHKFALDVLYELSAIDSKFFLLLLGDGSLKEHLRIYAKKLGIEKDILFLGNKANVGDYLSAADYFIFPSLYEGFPNALLEAETNGLFCFVSSNVTREVAIEGMCEYLDLDEGSINWAKKIADNMIVIERETSAENIINLGKDKLSEITKLTKFYEGIMHYEK